MVSLVSIDWVSLLYWVQGICIFQTHTMCCCLYLKFVYGQLRCLPCKFRIIIVIRRASAKVRHHHIHTYREKRQKMKPITLSISNEYQHRPRCRERAHWHSSAYLLAHHCKSWSRGSSSRSSSRQWTENPAVLVLLDREAKVMVVIMVDTTSLAFWLSPQCKKFRGIMLLESNLWHWSTVECRWASDSIDGPTRSCNIPLNFCFGLILDGLSSSDVHFFFKKKNII